MILVDTNSLPLLHKRSDESRYFLASRRVIEDVLKLCAALCGLGLRDNEEAQPISGPLLVLFALHHTLPLLLSLLPLAVLFSTILDDEEKLEVLLLTQKWR